MTSMAATDSSQASVVALRKRKARRRRQDKPALSARLVLDDRVKGHIGFLSEDLFSNLFPHLGAGKLLLLLNAPWKITDDWFP